jgi:hypothetical protein
MRKQLASLARGQLARESLESFATVSETRLELAVAFTVPTV